MLAESLVFVVSPSSVASEYCAAEFAPRGNAASGSSRSRSAAPTRGRPAGAPRAELDLVPRERRPRGGARRHSRGARHRPRLGSRAHALLVRAIDSDARSTSLLLRGKDLAEAERVLAANAGKDPRPTELQVHYLQESRRGARRRQRTLLGGVTIALGVSVVLGVLALLQRNDARICDPEGDLGRARVDVERPSRVAPRPGAPARVSPRTARARARRLAMRSSRRSRGRAASASRSSCEAAPTSAASSSPPTAVRSRPSTPTASFASGTCTLTRQSES